MGKVTEVYSAVPALKVFGCGISGYKIVKRIGGSRKVAQRNHIEILYIYFSNGSIYHI